MLGDFTVYRPTWYKKRKIGMGNLHLTEKKV